MASNGAASNGDPEARVNIAENCEPRRPPIGLLRNCRAMPTSHVGLTHHADVGVVSALSFFGHYTRVGPIRPEQLEGGAGRFF